MNCQFECDSRSSKIECDYTTGEKYCSDAKYNNPTLCNTLNKSCPTNAFNCSNGGNCVKV
ncbi:hypothetical protein HZS_1192 [Henneguya salminicola]|nr:hypothetical protein HZS_1192 [Henneguya salminicola]